MKEIAYVKQAFILKIELRATSFKYHWGSNTPQTQIRVSCFNLIRKFYPYFRGDFSFFFFLSLELSAMKSGISYQKSTLARPNIAIHNLPIITIGENMDEFCFRSQFNRLIWIGAIIFAQWGKLQMNFVLEKRKLLIHLYWIHLIFTVIKILFQEEWCRCG